MTDLDPSSQVLRQHYDEIVGIYSASPNDDDAIAELYASSTVIPAEEALRTLGTKHFTVEPPTRPSLVSRLFR